MPSCGDRWKLQVNTMRTPSCSHRSRMERGERGKMVCEVCGRKRRKGARITEAKVRNWSKKRETASRRKGGTGQVMRRQKHLSAFHLALLMQDLSKEAGKDSVLYRIASNNFTIHSFYQVIRICPVPTR